MTRQELLARIEEIGIMPAVRVGSREDALFASESVIHAGIHVVEITMTTPGAVGVISELNRLGSHAIVGAGTVLDVDTARRCVDAGAAFLSSPGLDLELMAFANEHDILLIPGALTPTEVLTAYRAGAGIVKVFPCASMGGATYIRALKGPFPDIPLLASGGVSQQTAGDFLRAGAGALGVGRELLPSEAIRVRNADWIRELARRFLGMVKEARTRDAP